MEAASISTHAVGHDAHEHHGPPPANRSSRVEPQFLGMLLFIISEVMVFGAFFTAYFFIRVVNGFPWPPAQFHLPVFVAGINSVKKHTRPNPMKNQQGGIVTKETPMHVSNVAIWNPITLSHQS